MLSDLLQLNLLVSDRKTKDSSSSGEVTVFSESKLSLSAPSSLRARSTIAKPLPSVGFSGDDKVSGKVIITTLLPSRNDGKEKSRPPNLQESRSFTETSTILLKERVAMDFTTMGIDIGNCSLGLTKILNLADVMCMKSDLNDFLLIKLKVDEVVSRCIKVNREVVSVLYSPRPANDLQRTVIATYELNESVSRITIYSHNNKSTDAFLDTSSNMTKIAVQVVPRLVYWMYSGLDTILMITESSTYSWKADGGTAKPIRLLDRVDNKNLGESRRIVDCSWTTDGWLLMTTAQKVQEYTSTSQTFSYLVSIYNVKNGKSYSFRAISGCFVKQSLVLEYLDFVSESSRSISSFHLSSISSKVESNSSLIFNVNEFVDSKDSPTPRWSTRLESSVSHAPTALSYNFKNRMYSALFSLDESIYHLDCITFSLTLLNEGSGLKGSSSTLQPTIAYDKTVLSYHIDGQNRQKPVLSLLLGDGNEMPEKIIKIDLNEKHL